MMKKKYNISSLKKQGNRFRNTREKIGVSSEQMVATHRGKKFSVIKKYTEGGKLTYFIIKWVAGFEVPAGSVRWVSNTAHLKGKRSYAISAERKTTMAKFCNNHFTGGVFYEH